MGRQKYEDLIISPCNKEIKKIHTIVLSFIHRYKLAGKTYGCKTFYTPNEWFEERSESTLEGAKLILVFDGSDIKKLFCDYSDKFTRYLKTFNLYWEYGDHWNAGIFQKSEL